MNLVRAAAAAVALIGIVGCSLVEPTDETGSAEVVAVDRVVDGDTVWVTTAAGQSEKVRILGIDTPELSPPAECWGSEATAALTQAVSGEGVTVELVADPMADDRDQYGRLLRYVEVDQVDVGLRLVEQGHAYLYRDADNLTRTAAYQDARDSAQDGQTGLWGACDR
ncbi:thermonuclease family protein [Aeromicrobium sp. Leaf350]|uniref:thermonuclease family protein n=1 Tax=Aeromicrobium sp. Leaf350 TaxID=2876565 RepID=UPI001E465F4E|nr:thermonuclease family protein [Aeromicrobium sp. Leaf350]